MLLLVVRWLASFVVCCGRCEPRCCLRLCCCLAHVDKCALLSVAAPCCLLSVGGVRCCIGDCCLFVGCLFVVVLVVCCCLALCTVRCNAPVVC